VFGSSGTPAYRGAGQPAPTGSASGTPAYKSPPPPPATPIEPQAPAIVVDMSAVPQPYPPDPFGGLPFVVIPRRDDD